MKKNYLEHIFSRGRTDMQKMLLIMKLTSFLMLMVCMQVSAKVYSQDNALTLNMDHVGIARALRVIEKKSDYRFLYNDALISPAMTVDVHAQDAMVPDIVGHILSGTALTYKLIGTHLIVIAAKNSEIQAIHLRGKVTDSAGNPLLGVTIQVKGASIGTVSDANGQYALDVPDDAKLIVSYIGFESQEITVGNKSTLDIVMHSSNSGLNEIVVIGYGTQRKSQVTGAISSVNAADLDNMPVTRVEQSLQGRSSGLTIAASSGQPGAASTVRIRGTTSINNSDPLYIVDGVPVDVGGIDYLNQSDIASIQVLKDAASAAIYGTRAASGVILITTKKGKAGAMQVNYSGYYGIQQPAKKLHLLDATQYATLRNESSVAGGGPIIFPDPESLGKGTDWQATIFNNSAKVQNHEISLSGGSDKSTYYASFGYYDQQGIVATPISQYRRFTVRLNTTHQLKDWLKFGENIGYSYIKSKGSLSTNSEFGGPLSSAINLDPTTPVVITDPNVLNQNPYNFQPVVKDAQGRPYAISNYVGQEMTNPLAYIQTRLGNYNWSHNFVGNVYVELEPIKGLTIRSSLGAKLAFFGNESFTPLYYLSPTQNNTANADFYRESNQGLIWNWDNTIAYTKSFGAHNLTFLVGTGAQSQSASGVNDTYQGIPASDFGDASMNFSIPTTSKPGGGYENQPYRLHSYFGRITYDYNGKYLLTGILRVDGSTRFGSNYRYGKFPSVSVGWVPTKEDFWHVNSDAINFLKIRASYGINGNDQSLSDFQYVSTVSGGRDYVFGDGTIYTGYSPNAPANPDLKWEQTSQLDLGFDADLFNVFSLTVDVYNKKTTGMLRQVKIPGYVGATGQPYGNVASLTDKGIEVELGYKKQIGSVNLNITGNASYVKNNITNIGDQDYITGATFQASAYEISRIVVGEPIGEFYGFKTLGIFQTQAQVDAYTNKAGQKIQPDARPGDFIWADLNGDGQITADSDRTFLGDPTPHWTFGLTASAEWHHFQLTAFGQGVSGNEIFQGLRRLDILTANYTTAALGRWTGEGTSNSFPRLDDKDPNKNFLYPSAFYLSDGAYFRIKTLQLGYNIPAATVKSIGMQKIFVYVSANNLVTFTKYTGYDPEIGGSSYGIDRGIYPQARSYMFGLNVTF